MDPNPFLEHAEWLERLAPALVFDSNQVDDVVQETWLTLLERPPRHATAPQGWLRSVLRNAARHSTRSRKRRAEHEAAAADLRAHSSVPTPDEALDRALTRRRVTDAVLGLAPLHREVILLHYFEDVPAEAIARQLRVPAATIRTRLHRAREALRQELDREFGDRRTWGLALVPWGRRGQAPAATSVVGSWGAWFVSKKVLTTALGLLLLLGFAVWRPSPWKSDSGLESTTAALAPKDGVDRKSTVQLSRRDRTVDSESEVGTESTGLSPSDETVGTAPDPAAPEDSFGLRPGDLPWTGYVVDPDGQRVAGIGLGWFPSEDLFRLHRDERLPVPFTEDELLTALARDLDVKALGERERAQIWHDALPGEFDSVDSLQPIFARTGRRGEFTLTPPSSLGDVFVTDDGWFVLGSEWTRGRTPETRELRLLVAPARLVAGRVVDTDGHPIGRASIEIGARRESIGTLQPDDFGTRGIRSVVLESDPDGRFETRAPDLREIGVLVRSESHEPKYVSWSSSINEPLVIVLEPKPAHEHGDIEGVVVDVDGGPVAGAQVFVGDDSTTSDERGSFRLRFPTSSTGTPVIAVAPGRGAAVGPGARPTPDPIELVLTAGRTLRGRLVPFDDADSLTDYRVSLYRATMFEDGWVEEVSADVPLPIQVVVDGSFELTGLLDRPYHLRVWHQPTFRGIITEPIPPADQDIVIELDRSDLWPTLRGRLVLPDGAPVANASVSLRWFTAEYSFGNNSESRRVGVTDAAGAFELHDVPRENTHLVLDHPAMKPIEWSTTLYDGAEIVFTAPALLRFTVDEADPARFDSIQVLDADLRSIPFTSYTAVSEHYGHVVELQSGSSGVCEVTPAAHFLALYRDGDEVRRLPLHLTPGEVTRIVP